MTIFPSTPVRRIDIDEDGGDDIAISNVKMFRLERMNDDYIWLCCYYENGGRDVFRIWDENGKLVLTHEDERE